MTLTLRAGIAALVGAVIVAVVPAHGLALLGVGLALLVTVTLDLGLAGSVRGLQLRREGATSVRLTDSAQVSLVVANPGSRRVRGRLRDAWVPSAGVTPASQPLDLPAGQARRLTSVLTPTRRGDRLPDRVTIRALGPLGLAARQGAHRVPWTLRVLPEFASRRHLPQRLAQLRQLDGAVATRIRGQGTEFDSLREYVDGDDVRSIDWRATARRAEVVVRTWRPERDRRVVIVLDTGRLSAGRIGDTPRLDWSLDAALLLAALAARAGDRVDVLAFDRQVRARMEGARRADAIPRTVQALATVEPALVETDMRGLVAEVLRMTRQRCLVVLLTGLDTAAVEEGLLPALAPLVARHTVLAASVADPRLAAMASARGDAEAVYSAAAAEQAGSARRRVAALLQRKGVEVVDALPDELAPALADAYLGLKAAGRL